MAVIPYSEKSLKTEEELHAKEVTETASYIQQIFDETKEAAEDQSDGGLMDIFNTLSFIEIGKLIHRLEQEFLSDEITEKDDSIDRPEPKDEYADLGLLKSTSSKQPLTIADAPSEIVLEMSLNYSNIYMSTQCFTLQ